MEVPIGVLLLWFGLLQSTGTTIIQGTVIDGHGLPLEQVEVNGFPLSYLITSAEGTYQVEGRLAFQMVRFSRIGYRPVTRSLMELSQDPRVVLVRDPDSVWRPPMCAGRDDGDRNKPLLRFLRRPDDKPKQAFDSDYEMELICRDGHCLRHGWGLNWSFGLPTRFDSKDFSETSERVVILFPEERLSQAAEWRGTRIDGTRSRWLGILGETISYDDVPPQIAEYFDSVLDSLCRRR